VVPPTFAVLTVLAEPPPDAPPPVLPVEPELPELPHPAAISAAATSAAGASHLFFMLSSVHWQVAPLP
jgi:hypothetical protein